MRGSGENFAESCFYYVLSGITKYYDLIIQDNTNIGNYIRNTGLNFSFYKLFVQIAHNDFFSYREDNQGDMGFCMRWDSNDMLFVMYSYGAMKIYWKSCKGDTWTGWTEL